ncbi:MAG: FAD-binding protein, partial [Ruminococcaceae bacterium]|nr:FAD-binding protein [Oscillospiraceae bacterium]
MGAHMTAEQISAAVGHFQKLGCQACANESMSRRTTFKIGGGADVLVTVSTESQLEAVLKYVKEQELPLLLLGNGSNMLVDD